MQYKLKVSHSVHFVAKFLAILVTQMKSMNIKGKKKWSEREDLNLRPPAPKADALPSCATLRMPVLYGKYSTLAIERFG